MWRSLQHGNAITNHPAKLQEPLGPRRALIFLTAPKPTPTLFTGAKPRKTR